MDPHRDHDHDDRDLAAAWRAQSRESPPPALDAAILAAAHRAVGSGPHRADAGAEAAARHPRAAASEAAASEAAASEAAASEAAASEAGTETRRPRKAAAEALRPPRWWMPFAAAAVIGAVAVGVVQLASHDVIDSSGPPPPVTSNAAPPAETTAAASAKEAGAADSQGKLAADSQAKRPADSQGKLPVDSQAKLAAVSPMPAVPPPPPVPMAPSAVAERNAVVAERNAAAPERNAAAPEPFPAAAAPPPAPATATKKESAGARKDIDSAQGEAAPRVAATQSFVAAPAQNRMRASDVTQDARRASPDVASPAQTGVATGPAADGASRDAASGVAPRAASSVPPSAAAGNASPSAVKPRSVPIRAKAIELARDPDAWIIRIRNLRDGGRDDEAAAELREFDALVPDAQQRMPPELRRFMQRESAK